MSPPRIARALVRLWSDPEDRAFLLEDVADRFRELARTRGVRAARRWYWSQALSVVPWTLRDGDSIRRRSWAGIGGDLRFGFRTLARHPLYAVGVAGTLGLGLAAALVTFALSWTVWLAPMPYPDPDRVVRLYEIEPAGDAAGASLDAESRRQLFSPTLLEAFRSHSFRTMSAVSLAAPGRIQMRRGGEIRSVSNVTLSPDGFGILGIVPTLGRLPVESETELLLGERYWRTAFGADPDIVGTTMRAGGEASVVVGVARLPSGFPGDVDLVDVIDFGDTEDRDFRVHETIARVRTGYSVAEAEAEANAFVAALARVHPEHRGWGVEAAVLADDLVRPFRGVLALFLAAGAIFLLLAGVNVMGLVAARRVEGRRDRSIRLALGASEGRLLRGSLIESLLLALVGSVAGVLSAHWLIGPIRALVPFDVPRLADVAITPPILLAGLSLGAVLGMIIGLSGYLVSRAAKPSVGRAPVWRAFGVGGRRALVVGQVALTTLLTAGGIAILHRVSTLRAIDLGFEPEGVSIASTLLPDRAAYDRWRVARAILDGLDARGIRAAMALNTPMSGGYIPLTDDAIPQPAMRTNAGSKQVVYDLHLVSPQYFSVMGIELLAGRDFGSQDHASSQRAVIVSEEFVDRYFPAGTPVESVIGRMIAPLIFEETGPMVVGVVESTRHDGPDMPVEPEIYSPLSQLALNAMSLVVQGEPDQVAEAVSSVVAQVIPGIPWTPLTPYTTHLKEWFAPFRLQIIAIGVLGALGLVLASLGLFAAMAYQVASRRREIGIRKAVGATDGRLMRHVLAGGVAMGAVGALIGLGAWYALLPRSRALVDGIDAAGSLVPLSVAAIVGGASVLATLVPALRATQVDPVVTLKAD